MKQKMGEHILYDQSKNGIYTPDKDLKELKNTKALEKKVINNLLSKQSSNINFYNTENEILACFYYKEFLI